MENLDNQIDKIEIERINRIESKLKTLPNSSGVYLMKDKDSKIIYVGKAVVLKNRVKQYFRKNTKSSRIEYMVKHIYDFEYIITDTEQEALILECNLIKKYMPKFNVLLKDDKTYPYIAVNLEDKFPKIQLTRRKKSGNIKYFGPYPNVLGAKAVIKYLEDKFKLRRCNNFKTLDKPCMYYEIGKCSAPCIKYNDEKYVEEYMQNISEVLIILKGDFKEIIEELQNSMKIESENMNFTVAAKIRDEIFNIQKIQQKQKISNYSDETIDALVVSMNELKISIDVFKIRSKDIQERQNILVDNLGIYTEEEMIETYIYQKYIDNVTDLDDVPKIILISKQLKNIDILEKLLYEKNNVKTKIIIPQKGLKLRLLEMIIVNSKETLKNSTKELDILKELKDILDMSELPHRIEMYDISHISGKNTVAGMAVLKEGKIDRRLFRKFKMIDTNDDYLNMKEVLSKRLKHTLEGKTGLGELPQVILVDGGKGQMSTALEVMKELKLQDKIVIAGVVKNDKHQTESLIISKKDIENNVYYEKVEVSRELKQLLSNIQIEVHNYAINYHRKIRDQKLTKSILEEIPNIGKEKTKRLYLKFKTIENIRNASIEELIEIPGITEGIAIEILKKLN